MKKIFKNLTQELQKKIKEKSMPSWIPPMLATLTKDYFSKEGWIFERKLDGERIIIYKNKNDVSLKTRNKKTVNVAYPEIEDAIKKIKLKTCILDGEIVAFEGNITSFSKLQPRMHISKKEEAEKSSVAVYYYIFDLLYLEGADIRELPLRARKSLLKKSIAFEDPLRYMIHRNKEGKKYHKEACKKGWEGLIAKDTESTYVSKRSKKWLKFKCVNEQEFVIGGYTNPKGERIGFGALLLGYYKNDKLIFAGRVGTGFDDEMLETLSEELKKIKIKENPFAAKKEIATKDVHWVKPKLVGQVGFTEWTKEGKLRHPRFLGLRRDKDPKDVIREKAS
ncbi:MAG: non-homologous end-joining DNA ligase [Candidatus Babeliales bacterium]